MIDLFVMVAMKEGKDYDSAMNLRERLCHEVEVDQQVRSVGGGVNFEPLMADENFECSNGGCALQALKGATGLLVAEGYRVTAYEGAPDHSIDAGDAVVVLGAD